MDNGMTETMERAREALVAHLCDLMDEVDGHGGRIPSRRLLGGIHDTLDSLAHIESMPKGTAPEKAK